MRKALTILLIISNIYAFSQNLLTSRKTSYYTYLYKISDAEALNIYKTNRIKIEKDSEYTLTDSFPTDSIYPKGLKDGHYLKMYAQKNKLNFSISSVHSFDLEILDNNTDLCVQLLDSTGKIISDAQVKIRDKKLNFDKKAQAFIHLKSNKKGLLCVIYQGNTFYFDLNRAHYNPGFKRVTNKVLYHSPIKYLWRPINFVIHLPIDGAKSISKHYTYGTIFRSVNFFANGYNKITGLFNGESYERPDFNKKYLGYLVFSKPKYHPGDTVKLKAFIVKNNGKPVNNEIDVVLVNGKGKHYKLTRLKPYDKGGYEYQFFTHDSLDLQLDKYCKIMLQKKEGKAYIEKYFDYEDYDLSGVKLNLRTTDYEQFKGKEFKVFLSANDENGLSLPDARVELFLTTINVEKYYKPVVYIPDTLFAIKKKLNPSGETEISISDSIFPEVNLKYKLYARLLTADNDKTEESKEIDYYSKKKEIEMDLNEDSALFTYKENGLVKNIEAKIYGMDKFGNETEIATNKLPFQLKINPYYFKYQVYTIETENSFIISDEEALIQCTSERTHDSIHILIENPRKIQFNYFIYKVNKELYKGFGNTFELHERANNKVNYFVSLQFIWGGKIINKDFKIGYDENTLDIKVFGPQLIYPGQKTNFKVLVTDHNGIPAKNVDLTAYSFTKKFDSFSPDIPQFSEKHKHKTVINNFKLRNNYTSRQGTQYPDINKWEKSTSLDSIEYYRFLYPGHKIYKFSYLPKDSVCQFSPFVMNRGNIQAVHVIYVDNLPVYFSWTAAGLPYSFKVSSGYHQIKLRTERKLITIDSLYFTENQKLIFSLEDTLAKKNVSCTDVEKKLSDNEKSNLDRYILKYRNNFGDNLAYIEQSDNFIPLNFMRYSNYIGPILGRNIKYCLLDSFENELVHEPYFEYEFNKDLVKMRSIQANSYQQYLQGNTVEQLKDIPLNKAAVLNEWDEIKYQKNYDGIRGKINYSQSISPSSLLIHLKYKENSSMPKPLFILIKEFGTWSYLKIYPDKIYAFDEIQKTYHKLVFIYPGKQYSIIDSLCLKPYGLNYYEYNEPDSLTNGIFKIEDEWTRESGKYMPVGNNDYAHNNNVSMENLPIYSNYLRQTQSATNISYNTSNYLSWRTIEGTILDNVDNQPIPGVNILVKGTALGTISDFEGHYSIKVPNEASTLIFSYIGMATKEVAIINKLLNVGLDEDNIGIAEVIVMAYGTVTKSCATGSISMVRAESLINERSVSYENSLSGIAAGVNITGAPGAIVIRGTSRLAVSSEPLYIIDGQVYTGKDIRLDEIEILSVNVLKDASATAIYGARASNGVIIITTKNGLPDTKIKGASYDKEFYKASMSNSTLRSNFSDYAFWQPKLKTDENGIASFNVTFPDDITSWNTHFIAMNGKRQSGQKEGFIKSYKPLMAQLSVPRFLIKGDSSNIIGKVKNYTNDTVQLTSKLEVKDSTVYSKNQSFADVVIDTIPVQANLSDTLTMRYLCEKSDGYFDGEERDIPILPIGLEETKGQFIVLDKDSTIELEFDTTLSDVTLYAKATELEVINDEIGSLINYKYACNEQLASKLKALLARKNICKFYNQTFKYDKVTQEIIDKLSKNQQNNGLWGWWNQSGKSYWISLHVVEALAAAREAGYQLNFNKQNVGENLVWDLESNQSFNRKIKILDLLRYFNAVIDYQKYIAALDTCRGLLLYEKLKLIEQKQLNNIRFDKDSVLKYLKKTLFGNYYFEDNQKINYFYENDIHSSLLAYRILQRDSLTSADTLLKIRNYLFEKRSNGFWQNTYESAQIIEAILPDILIKKDKIVHPSLVLSGAVNKKIDKFPFEIKLKPNQVLKVNKTGTFPVYLTAYQQFWNNKPKSKSNDFSIETSFKEQDSVGYLISGKAYTFETKVVVKKNADYVMIEVPIPAGCSYDDKTSRYYPEVNREYYKHKVSIFCEHLNAVTYNFDIKIIPRYTGVYTLNPAKVELMYFPTFNANNAIKKVKVE